jgi:hypothetical protein
LEVGVAVPFVAEEAEVEEGNMDPVELKMNHLLSEN